MNIRRDNIYIYIWEELNTIYVGRTVSPKKRDWSHKHRESETTHKFSSKHHVEHPKMIIIENDLTTEEGLEREKYWINEYRENSHYNILNKTKGGEVGWLSGMTDDEREERRKLSEQKRKKYLKEYKTIHREEILEKNRKYVKENKEKIIEYRQKNREKISLKKKIYAEEHKKEIALYQKNYVEENKVKLSNYKKAYREAHKEEIALKNKEYRETNKEKLYKSHKNYVEKNKEKIAAYKKQWYEERKLNLLNQPQ